MITFACGFLCRDAAMIQPSLTGLVHALFATQHCVLGYYQAVPAGLHATNSCRRSGAGEECTSYQTGAILPSRKSLENVETSRGTTSVVPHTDQKDSGFSPCCGKTRTKHQVRKQFLPSSCATWPRKDRGG